MIVVYTKNGNEFVNDKETFAVRHDKNNECVYVWPTEGATHKISGVVQVEYISDKAEATIIEDGNELETLQKKYDDQHKYANRMRAYYFKLMEKNSALLEEIDKELKEENPKLFDYEQAD